MSTVSIHPNRISITPSGSRSSAEKLVDAVSPSSIYQLRESNFLSNFAIKANPFILSRSSKRKLFDSINLLYTLSTKRNVKMRNGKSIFNFRASFITLTLPSKQMHSDTFIKKSCLNQLFVELRAFYDFKNYVWKAELQKNENIHFHIITDSYIDYQALRRRWNRILEKHGYVSAYSEKMNSLSFADYHKLRNKYSECAIEKSSSAYYKGRSDNWKNPNSVDIKSVRNKKNLAAYLGKYVSKNVADLALSPENSDSFSPEEQVLFSRQMAFGRSWYRSYSLSSFKQAIKFEFSCVGDLIHYMDSTKDRVLKIIGDFFTCYYFDLDSLDEFFRSRIYTAIRMNADYYGYSSA